MSVRYHYDQFPKITIRRFSRSAVESCVINNKDGCYVDCYVGSTTSSERCSTRRVAASDRGCATRNFRAHRTAHCPGISACTCKQSDGNQILYFIWLSTKCGMILRTIGKQIWMQTLFQQKFNLYIKKIFSRSF